MASLSLARLYVPHMWHRLLNASHMCGPCVVARTTYVAHMRLAQRHMWNTVFSCVETKLGMNHICGFMFARGTTYVAHVWLHVWGGNHICGTYQVVFASFIGAILDLAAERRGLHFCSRMVLRRVLAAGSVQRIVTSHYRLTLHKFIFYLISHEF